MLEEDYVSFETAKLLKEKGFDEDCYNYYDNEGYIFFNHIGYINSEKFSDDFCALAPTYQTAMRWLREKDVQIEITIVGINTWESPTKWMYGFRCQTRDIIDRRNADFSSYEEAAEAAIKYCLENLI